jgi:hypothetical protein
MVSLSPQIPRKKWPLLNESLPGIASSEYAIEVQRAIPFSK